MPGKEDKLDDEVEYTSMTLVQMPEKMDTAEDIQQYKHFLVQRDSVLTVMASDEERGKGSKTDSALMYQMITEYSVCGLSYDVSNGSGTYTCNIHPDGSSEFLGILGWECIHIHLSLLVSFFFSPMQAQMCR